MIAARIASLMATIALGLLLSAHASQPTLPRHADPPAADAPPPEVRKPTDPLYDKPMGATDGPAFMRTAVENLRQGVADARAAETGLPTPELRQAAASIGRQQRATLAQLEALAKSRGWRLPQGNPERTGTVPVSGAARTSADFIVYQIAYHETMITQLEAQLRTRSGSDGARQEEGDAQLRRVLREALPGYRKNLDMLLRLRL